MTGILHHRDEHYGTSDLADKKRTLKYFQSYTYSQFKIKSFSKINRKFSKKRNVKYTCNIYKDIIEFWIGIPSV